MRLADYLRLFSAHARNKIAVAKVDPAPLALKRIHTMRVYANARKIAEMENFSPQLARMCHLAALFHDFARFDQYLEYGTFKDAQSANHGLWAVKLLKKGGILNGEPKQARQAVLASIGLHNRRDLPPGLRGDVLKTAMVTRDADKLDIIRVIDEHLAATKPYNPTVVLSLPDSENLYGENVIAAALAHKSAGYADLKSVNDFRLLLGTWIFDMNFSSSRRMFAQSPHARRLVACLPDNAIYGKARSVILDCLTEAVST